MNPAFPEYSNLNYLDLAFSASYLRRFHMCRVQRESSLTDHSARVAYAFKHFFHTWKKDFAPVGSGITIDMREVELIGLNMALDHDLIEALTGDLPSHSKTPVIKKELDAIEDALLESVQESEVFLKSLFKSDKAEWKLAKALVKLSDIAEGLTFSYYNQGLGHLSPDDKSRWVNNNWDKIARTFVAGMDPELFSDQFKRWAVSFIVDKKLGIAAQHA